MKPILVIIILLLETNISYSQADLGFQNGMIITQTQDTINCLVPIASSFGQEIETKINKDSPTNIISLSSIKYLVTDFNVYEHVSFLKDDKEIHKLMWLEIEGKLTLYLEVERSLVGGSHRETNLTITHLGPPGKTYVVKKAGKTYLIGDKKEFIESIKPLIEDIPDLGAKLEAKKYTYKNIEELIREYNRLSASD